MAFDRPVLRAPLYKNGLTFATLAEMGALFHISFFPTYTDATQTINLATFHSGGLAAPPTVLAALLAHPILPPHVTFCAATTRVSSAILSVRLG